MSNETPQTSLPQRTWIAKFTPETLQAYLSNPDPSSQLRRSNTVWSDDFDNIIGPLSPSDNQKSWSRRELNRGEPHCHSTITSIHTATQIYWSTDLVRPICFSLTTALSTVSWKDSGSWWHPLSYWVLSRRWSGLLACVSGRVVRYYVVAAVRQTNHCSDLGHKDGAHSPRPWYSGRKSEEIPDSGSRRVSR